MKVRCLVKTLNNKKPEKKATSFFGEMANRLGFLKEPAAVKRVLMCWRAFKTDQLRVLNFDQTFMDVDYYTTVDKSTKLTGS